MLAGKQLEIRSALEKEIGGSLLVLKPILGSVSLEELYDFMTENFPNIMDKYSLTSNMLRELLFDVFSDTLYSFEEIEKLKSDVLKGKNNTLVMNTQLFQYFEENDISIETLSTAFSRKLTSLEYTVLVHWISKKSLALNTLDPDFFKEEYIQLFGSSYERLASYISTQRNVLKILQDDKKYSFYQRINSYYGKMSASDIERICIQIEEMDISLIEIFDNAPKQMDMNRLAAFFLVHPPIFPIQTVDDLVGYEHKVNSGLEEAINHVTNVDVLKQSILQRIFGMDLKEAILFNRRYGLDIEDLAQQEPLNSDYVAIMIMIQKIVNSNNLEELQTYYGNVKEPQTFHPMDVRLNIDRKLSSSFNENLLRTINNSSPQKQVIEDNEKDGYRIVKISGKYQKMVSCIDAFGDSLDSTKTMSLGEKLHGDLSKANHARCYSLMSSTNPGIHHSGYNANAVIITIDNFSPEAILASSNKDIGSSSTSNISSYYEDFLFYTTGNKFTDTIRDHYSELAIENEKNSSETMVSTLLCMDAVNDNTLNAAKDLSKHYHRKIDIEVIDTRDLIKSHMDYIASEYQKFQDTLDVQHLINYIRQILNTYSAFSKVEKFSDFFEYEFSMPSFCQNIQQCVYAIEGNPDAIARLQSYFQREKKVSSLIDLLLPMQDENIYAAQK